MTVTCTALIAEKPHQKGMPHPIAMLQTIVATMPANIIAPKGLSASGEKGFTKRLFPTSVKSIRKPMNTPICAHGEATVRTAQVVKAAATPYPYGDDSIF